MEAPAVRLSATDMKLFFCAQHRIMNNQTCCMTILPHLRPASHLPHCKQLLHALHETGQQQQ